MTSKLSMTNHTLAAYHRLPENFNCAQAVLVGFQAVTGTQVAAVDSYESYGGGRAPENECGALYAACQCAPDKAAQLRTEFKARVGSCKCRELKRELRVPCKECVATAADLLQAHTQNPQS